MSVKQVPGLNDAAAALWAHESIATMHRRGSACSSGFAGRSRMLTKWSRC